MKHQIGEQDEINRIWHTVRYLDLQRPIAFHGPRAVEADCMWQIRTAAQDHYIALIEHREQRGV